MTRCQHCNKLTHSEDLYIKASVKDIDKIQELTRLSEWLMAYQYDTGKLSPKEYGKLRCGDINIHFILEID